MICQVFQKDAENRSTSASLPFALGWGCGGGGNWILPGLASCSLKPLLALPRVLHVLGSLLLGLCGVGGGERTPSLDYSLCSHPLSHYRASEGLPLILSALSLCLLFLLFLNSYGFVGVFGGRGIRASGNWLFFPPNIIFLFLCLFLS